jgi:hypothetical protein
MWDGLTSEQKLDLGQRHVVYTLHKNGMSEDGCTAMLHGGQTVKNGPEVSRRMPKGGGAQGAFESTL